MKQLCKYKAVKLTLDTYSEYRNAIIPIVYKFTMLALMALVTTIDALGHF